MENYSVIFTCLLILASQTEYSPNSSSLATRMVTNGVVGGVVDGSLQLARNVLEGRCDVLEGVGQQAITGAIE